MRIAHRLFWLLRPLGFVTQVVLGVSIASTCALLIISQTSSPKAPPGSVPFEVPATPPELLEQKIKSEALFGMPVRLKISKIGVDAAIEQLDVARDGNMQAPAKAKNVGWYKLGPKPGSEGSAVIAGHFGSGRYRGKSAFDDLHTLSKGDTISVEDEAGTTIIFTVRESRIYAKDEIVPGVFVSSDGKAHLNLVTCQGKWKAAEQTYENRLVIFADKVND